MKTAVTISACIALLVPLSGCRVGKAEYYARGNKFYAAGKYEDAALNYRKAIQKDFNLGEAYYRLGLTEIKLGQGRDAYQALFRAVQLLPANMEAKEELAGVCLSFYLADSTRPRLLYQQIGSLADELLSKNPKSYQGLMLKGYLASTDRKPKEAIELFQKAIALDSSNAGVATELVSLLIQDGQDNQAESLASDLIDRRKTSYGPIYDLMHRYYAEAGRSQEALRVLESKVNNNPTQADYILQLASYYQAAKNQPAMQAALERLIDEPGTFSNARLLVGNFYRNLRNYAEAMRFYQQGLSSTSDRDLKASYRKAIILAFAEQGQKQEALRVAEEALKENPGDQSVMRLHVGLLLDSGRRQTVDTALDELAVLIKQSPHDPALLIEQGRAFRMQGNREAARKAFLDALRQQNDLSLARYELAELNLSESQPQAALQQTGELLKLQPRDRRARLLRTRALIGTGDITGARAELAQLIKENPEDPEPHVQLGFLALAEHKYSEAIEILSKARDAGEERAPVGLATAYLHLRQFGAARQVLNAGLQRWPDSVPLLEHLADTEALSGNYQVAAASLQRLLAMDPQSMELYRRLAEVTALSGDQAKALLYYQQAQRLAPADPAVNLALAEALMRAGRMEDARAIYLKVVKSNPENAPALNNAAYFLADSGGDLDEALRLAKRALEKAPNQPDFSDTVGYIYLKKGQRDSAIQTFRSLARRYPTYGLFRYHLGLALYENGDRASARRELQSALANHPSEQDKLRIRELLARIG